MSALLWIGAVTGAVLVPFASVASCRISTVLVPERAPLEATAVRMPLSLELTCILCKAEADIRFVSGFKMSK